MTSMNGFLACKRISQTSDGTEIAGSLPYSVKLCKEGEERKNHEKRALGDATRGTSGKIDSS